MKDGDHISESILMRFRLMDSRLKINVDKIYDINRKIKRHLKMENRFSLLIKDLLIKEKAEVLENIKDFDYQIFITFILLRMLEIINQNRFLFNEYPSLSTVRAWMKDELEMSI